MDTSGSASAPAEKLSQLAYRRFKEALFDKRIAAGAVLSQADLVAITGVPIGPLREAMQVLQSEGVLRIRSRSGIEIAKPDLDYVRNAFQLRQILELPAVRVAAETMPRPQLEALVQAHEAWLGRLPGLEVTPEIAQAAEKQDLAMHHELVGFLTNPLLDRAYRQAHDCIRLIRMDRLGRLSAAIITRTMQEHLAILHACLARDPDKAQAALELHFAMAVQRSLGL